MHSYRNLFCVLITYYTLKRCDPFSDPECSAFHYLQLQINWTSPDSDITDNIGKTGTLKHSDTVTDVKKLRLDFIYSVAEGAGAGYAS